MKGRKKCASGFCSSCMHCKCMCFTTSVCASSNTAWYCIIFSLPTFTVDCIIFFSPYIVGCLHTEHKVFVCVRDFLSHKFSLIVGIWLYKYHSHVEWNITTSSPLNMGIYCTCCYYHYIHMYVGHIDKTNTPSICFEVNFKIDRFFGFVFPSKFSKQIILLKKGL